ncbi:flagellar biosynthesis protein FlgF [Candidatus Tenderia electrophaga]|jgi:flagellar basal-body rod protein FlgF|uniref:Flagellar basal-body rod protein FlgF n=1 Tax=Candidatus Tenderia electrophaga TaxID=1748243 RepID=A0A0S2TBU6_9GAMM|nr:flagellar biosynthesis protein FlgF [Candidatus Tenderia electrophaga]
MDKFLYIASSGAKELMLAQSINANNLANANTVGFREDQAFYKALQMSGAGHASRAYVDTQGQGADFSPGSLMPTGRDLDVAIRGEGWVAVQGVDGTEAYTRAGDLKVSAAGLLTTNTGHPVIGNNAGPITLPPFEKIEIGGDGTISVIPRGQEASTLAVVDRIKLVKPDNNQLKKGVDGLFRHTDGIEVASDAEVRLISGTLESSNVNVVESMVKTMELARRFELQVKLMEQAKTLDESSTSIMKMN